jgi:predicted acylesterase/phospholipase RssA
MTMASEPKFVTFVQEYEGDVKSEKPYVWNLVSGDGTKLAFAPGRYGSQQGALNAIESIQTRAPYNREDFTEDWGPRGYSWKLKKGETDLAVSPGIFATRAELEASIGLVISALPGSKYRLAEIESRTQSKSRIGLALSGGGFRASLFHLGVIRRLEELGIMQDVAVISCISGGSIIGAYYTVEMQNRLRPFLAQHKDKLDNVDEDFLKKLNKERLRLFVRIADDFFRAIDKNIRTRAFFFPYFYHPVEFLKRLIPFLSAKTRGEWIRLEYDKHLFHGADMDQLPAYNLERMPEEGHLRIGPKVYINASSLLSGELVPFAREQVVGFDEMRKPNTNVAKLSHIVGASSAFPGLIPPIAYAGDVLVDGGNNDNQALKIFIGHQRHLAPQRIPHEEVDVLLVSDGSGQIAQLDSIGTDGKSVLPRVVNVLTHEVRNRNLEEIAMWKDMAKTQRQFAYIQYPPNTSAH